MRAITASKAARYEGIYFLSGRLFITNNPVKWGVNDGEYGNRIYSFENHIHIKFWRGISARKTYS